MTESWRTIPKAMPGTFHVLSAAWTYASRPGYGSCELGEGDWAAAGPAAASANDSPTNVRILYTASIPRERAGNHTRLRPPEFQPALVRRAFRAYHREHGLYTCRIPTAFQGVGMREHGRRWRHAAVRAFLGVLTSAAVAGGAAAQGAGSVAGYVERAAGAAPVDAAQIGVDGRAGVGA